MCVCVAGSDDAIRTGCVWGNNGFVVYPGGPCLWFGHVWALAMRAVKATHAHRISTEHLSTDFSLMLLKVLGQDEDEAAPGPRRSTEMD